MNRPDRPNLALIAERVSSAGQFFDGLSVQDSVLLMIATLSSMPNTTPATSGSSGTGRSICSRLSGHRVPSDLRHRRIGMTQ